MNEIPTTSKPHPVDLSRRGYESLPAISPHNGRPWDLLISHDTLDWIAKTGLGRSRELAFVVKPELLKPKAIFQGVRDLEHEISEDEWLCYVCQPNFCYDYKSGEKRTSAWENEVMLVYINDERVFYNWYWVESDDRVSFRPNGYETRFSKQVL